MPTSDVRRQSTENEVGIHPIDHRRPACRSTIEDVDVDAPVPDLDVHDQPAAVGGERDVGPRLGVGTVVPHDRVVVPVLAEAMVVDGAVVLVAGGIADVEEPRAVRLPGHRARPRVGDAVTVAAGRRAVDAGHEVQLGVLGPALADADGDQRAIAEG